MGAGGNRKSALLLLLARLAIYKASPQKYATCECWNGCRAKLYYICYDCRCVCVSVCVWFMARVCQCVYVCFSAVFLKLSGTFQVVLRLACYLNFNCSLIHCMLFCASFVLLFFFTPPHSHYSTTPAPYLIKNACLGRCTLRQVLVVVVVPIVVFAHWN